MTIKWVAEVGTGNIGSKDVEEVRINYGLCRCGNNQEISCVKKIGATLPTKVRLVKPMVFPMVMYGCESWTVKRAEPGRIDAFELWCWRRLSRAPWTIACQGPLSMEFSREEYWSGLPFPTLRYVNY